MALVKICPTCKLKNSPASPFCGECGVSLVSISPCDPDESPIAPIVQKPKEIASKNCPDCGSKNDSSSDHCIYCDCSLRAPLCEDKCPQVELTWPWGKSLLNEPLRIGREHPAPDELIKSINSMGYDNISRCHADLFPATAETSASVVDLGTTNGTFIDGVRIPASKPISLKHGSIIRFAANLEVVITIV
jgi:hypothetical protein